MSLLCGLETDKGKKLVRVDERVFKGARDLFFCPLYQSWIFYDFDFPRLLCVASTRHTERHKKLVKLFNLFFLGIINIWTQTNNRIAKTPSVICWSAKNWARAFFWFFVVSVGRFFLGFVICIKFYLILYDTNVKLYIARDYGAF